MRTMNRMLLALFALGVVCLAPACNSALDDGDSADVVLEVMNVTSSAVESQDDGAGGGCVFTVTEWTAQLRNQPKNEFGTVSPFGDIRLTRVTISYIWDDGFVTPTRDFSIAGTVPAANQQSITFTPILLGDLDSSREGHSADLTMNFQGLTVDNYSVSALATGKTLNVNSCITTSGP